MLNDVVVGRRRRKEELKTKKKKKKGLAVVGFLISPTLTSVIFCLSA